MPVYEYYCEANDTRVEVQHPIAVRIRTWGELCYAARVPLGDTDFMEPVRKLISAPAIAVQPGNADLKAMGFTKLVKRDAGVYENVTAGDSEARYMEAGKPESLPDIGRKVRD